MKKGNWMTAQQAVDFGLVDSIRTDASAEKAANEFNSSFINNYTKIYKDAGIPPLPSEEDDKLSLIADDNGNPTQSFCRRRGMDSRTSSVTHTRKIIITK